MLLKLYGFVFGKIFLINLLLCELAMLEIFSVDSMQRSFFISVHSAQNVGFYRDKGLILIRNQNRQKTGRITKQVIKIFKEIGFKTEIQTNLKVVNFLDITFNQRNGT